jgi:hypothetical protein
MAVKKKTTTPKRGLPNIPGVPKVPKDLVSSMSVKDVYRVALRGPVGVFGLRVVQGKLIISSSEVPSATVLQVPDTKRPVIVTLSQ